jgi:hypothetical protein
MQKTSPRQIRIQAEDEIRAFLAFCEASHLAINRDSIEKRLPPEPDIFCKLEDGAMLAFELVEICHPKNARFFGSAGIIGDAIEKTYRELPDSLRDRFTSRFAGKPLSFTFDPDASLNKIRRILPRLFAEIVDQPETFGQFHAFSKTVQKNLICVRHVGRVELPDRPSFNVASSFQADDVIIESVRFKLRHRYETPHPIELLAYIGGNAWGRSSSWKMSLQNLLQSEGLGSFRRVWVLGWSGIDFVYPQS